MHYIKKFRLEPEATTRSRVLTVPGVVSCVSLREICTGRKKKSEMGLLEIVSPTDEIQTPCTSCAVDARLRTPCNEVEISTFKFPATAFELGSLETAICE